MYWRVSPVVAMKRQASVPVDVVEHGDYLYTTLDLASPDCLHGASYGGTGSCQRQYIGIPKGWELAPWEEGARGDAHAKNGEEPSA